MSALKKIFSPKGPIASKHHRYEKREAQVKMALRVEAVLESSGVLLAEAGTGIGKTLAYLIPAFLSGQKVIISTGTKNLQEQIFFKDLLFVCEAFNQNPKIAYLKGQDNYLCRTRAKQFFHSAKSLAYPSEKVADLSAWSNSTVTGDRMELPYLADNDPIWNEVCSTKETRLGHKCPFFDECFVTLARRKATHAQLIVVNHHLYFADLATKIRGGSLLPAHDIVVFDEAHLLEDIATEFFSMRVSKGRIDRAVSDGFLACKNAKFQNDSDDKKRIKFQKKVSNLNAILSRLLSSNVGKTRLYPGQLKEEVINAYHKLDSSLEAFLFSLMKFEGRDDYLDHCCSRIKIIREDLACIIDGNQNGFISWIESKPRSTILGASPVDVSSYLKDELLLKKETVIFCSATLTTSGNFDYFKSRMGIDFDCEEFVAQTPFDYNKQSRIYIPDIPEPANGQYIKAALIQIKKLIGLSKGATLILCTSIKNMNLFADELSQFFDGIVLKQGQAPKIRLIQQFISEKNAVLVATSSFWQGVDIPGDDLNMVIIDKLPFASPGDPIIGARIEDLKNKNIEPFWYYQLPQAALTLKQGFGRLIRTAFDAGVVVILDSRLLTKNYSKEFISSLPATKILHDFSRLEKWWNNK